MKLLKTQLFNIFGGFFFLLGIVGAFLPILPTTPFILLASYFFSKGSPKFHNWLLNLKYFGPKIRNWENHGAIDKKSKIIASILLISILSYFVFVTDRELWLKFLLGIILLLVGIFINTRPNK